MHYTLVLAGFAASKGFSVLQVARAPHTIDSDTLAKSRVTPRWRLVSSRMEIGAGENRMVLYPLRGAWTERQYMVYFPERRLLGLRDAPGTDPVEPSRCVDRQSAHDIAS
jgi:hypothetical protein